MILKLQNTVVRDIEYVWPTYLCSIRVESDVVKINEQNPDRQYMYILSNST